MASMPTMVFYGISSMKKLQAGGWHRCSMDMCVMLGQAGVWEIANGSVLQPNDNTYATWSQKSALGFVAIYLGLADSEKTHINGLVDLVDRGPQAWSALSWSSCYKFHYHLCQYQKANVQCLPYL